MKQTLTLIALLFPLSILSQNTIAIETRAYPAGVIPGIRADIQISNTSFLTVQGAYNFTDRRDWGEHDKEEGGGVGFGIGYIYSGVFNENLSLHFRSDFWFMDIDWDDTRTICGTVPPCMDMDVTGTSEIIVFQPTLGAEYKIPLSDKILLRPSLSFGYEINIKTEGEDVGEGAILLGGFSLGYVF